MSRPSNNSELDIVIKEVKYELKDIFLKRKDIIIKLGNEFQKVVANSESVCEEIKIALREEIADHVISSRDIERYCPDKWKKKTKPQKNDRLSFLMRAEEQEKGGRKIIAIDTHGSSIEELKSITNTTQTRNNENENTCNLQPQHKLTNIGNNIIDLHTCPNCKQPLLEYQRIQNEKDIKIKELKDEIQQYLNDLNIKTAENAGMQTQLDHLKEQLQVKDENNGSVSSSFNNYPQLESSPIVDLEFPLHYEDVRRYVSSRLEISGVLGPLWFSCRLDKRTCRIIAAYPGKIIERKVVVNKEYTRNE